MSLILEALKRSEQERRRERGPDLQTIHQPLPGRAPTRSRLGWWVSALVLANIGVLVGWWWQQQARLPQPAAQPAQDQAVSAPKPAPPPETAVAVAKPEPAATRTPAANSEFTQVTPRHPPAGPVSGSVAARRDPIREIAELPERVRKDLPAMTFSFHVYSSDPQKRTIIINNRRFREGDEVSDGVLLQEITEDGVILAIPDYRVHIGVLAGW